MDQAFGCAQGDHGNTVGVVDVPTGIFILMVEREVFAKASQEIQNINA